MPRKMLTRRALALVLCAALALGLLAGCGPSAPEKGGGTPLGFSLRLDAAGARRTDTPVRADLDYAGMTYARFDRSRLRALTGPLYEIAASGGTQAEFDAADDALTAALQEISAMYALMQVRYSQDPADEAADDELLYAGDTLNEANQDCRDALRAVAASSHAALMESRYTRSEIYRFRGMASAEGDSGEANALASRESALVQQYEALAAADTLDADAVAALYVQLVGLRRQIAAAHGYASYAEYAYEGLYARSYSPGDAQALWAAVQQAFLPVIEANRAAVARGTARVSAAAADTSPDAILGAMRQVLPRISPDLAEPFAYLTEHRLYDLADSAAKSDTGYTTYFYGWNEPFIFNRPSGSFYDYTTTFHEFGHFVSLYRHGSDLMFGAADNDLCELQSQGMEVLFLPYYEDIFGADGPAARDSVVMNLLYSVAEGAMYDEFQQKVYAEDDLTAARVQEIFGAVAAEYGYDDYVDYETAWMRVAHNFENPFYYISYAVSAVSALELYGMAPADAAAAYETVENLDPERCHFRQALARAGLSDPFDGAVCARIAAAVNDRFTA